MRRKPNRECKDLKPLVEMPAAFLLRGVIMARLQSIKPSLKTVRPMLAPITQDKSERSRLRDKDAPWRKLYKTARWQRLRWKVIEQALFTCAMCGKFEADTSQLVADHIIPHKGNEAMFWDKDNLQCLCRCCHDTTKKRMERRSNRWGGVKSSIVSIA